MSAKKIMILASMTAFMLAVVKLVVGFFSGSVAVFASAVDSILDVLLSMFNYLALHQSDQPANKKFNYGYGKIQSLAALLEGMIIAGSGLYIFYEAINKLMYGRDVLEFSPAIGVMIFSFLVTACLVVFLGFMIKRNNNQVLKADLLHYKTDLFSNGAILLSLVLIYFTGWQSIDCILGIGVAIYVIYGAWGVIKEGILNLMDRSVDDGLLEQINLTLSRAPVVSYHGLKSRISGNTLFLEMHLVFDEAISLFDAHSISETVEKELSDLDPRLEWMILTHFDPYDDSLNNIAA